jgi:hypothetical protein
MRVRDLNWMQLDEYLERDDRVVLPLGSTEQHAYLSLETDNILAERVSVEAAEPLGVPVLPVLPYGLTPTFAAVYPGSPTLRLETYAALLRELLDSLYRQGFRRFLLVNGHGGNTPAGPLAASGRPIIPTRRRSSTPGGPGPRCGRSRWRSTPSTRTRTGARTFRGRACRVSRRPPSGSRC